MPAVETELECITRYLERFAYELNRQQTALHEELLHRMLCLWVSELDPCMVYDRHGNLLGLCAEGDYGDQRIPITVRVGQVIEPVF